MNKKKVTVGVGILIFLISVLPQDISCTLSCDVWVDKGCGSTYEIGETITIYFEVNTDAYIELWLTFPDGSTSLRAQGSICGGVTYNDTGYVGEPAGKRTLVLKAWSGAEYDSDTCTYYGSEPPGSIRVESTPSGADVYLDQSYEGKTPLTIRDVSPGSHTLRVIKSGYKEWTKTVTVYSNETTYVNAALQKELGSIHVTSNPSGAKVYLDGSYKGTTPLTIGDVSTGNHTLTLKKNGYYDWERSYNVSAGETVDVYASLELKVGYLNVRSNVEGASVYVDGSYKGTIPLYVGIPVGMHTVTVSANKYYDYTTSVTVETDRTVYVEASLEEKPGSIYVESIPSGAEVYLDGSYKGKTPLTIATLKRGTYTLVVKYSGHYDERLNVSVYPDETTTNEVYLRKVFWRTGYFAFGVIVLIAVIAIAFRYLRKQPTVPTPTKLKSTFESAARIARAPFVPIEMLLHIVLPEKENRCPICDKSLDGKIVECIHCKNEGFTCKFHNECWEGHKVQQGGNRQDKIRCYKHTNLYVTNESIRYLSQKDVSKK